MTPSFTLAQLSDVHLSPLTGFEARHVNAKRLMGAFNWGRRRRHVHRRAVADMLVADALSLNVDHIAVTGDLTNLGLPLECAAAAEWLRSVAGPDRVTVVPGNHDVYAPPMGDIGVARWAAYMGCEAESLAFPFVRRVGPLTLIGLNSGTPTPPLFASGRLGGEQIDIVSDLLKSLGDDGAIRVVLIHHPPLPGLTAGRRALTDAAHFQRALERNGAELVLYGHNHRVKFDWLASHGAPIPIVGAASASAALPHNGDGLASYNLFTFFSTNGRNRIRWTVRGLSEIGGPVTHVSETFLEPAM